MSAETLLKEMQQFRTVAALSVLAGLILWESFFPFLREFARGGLRERVVHGLRNLCFAAMNFVIGALVFGAAWLVSATYAQEHGYGILNWLSLSGTPHLLGAILLWDFWTYWWHRWNHEIPFLWRFHQVHHSDPNMDVTTAYRFHMGEIVLSSTLRIGLIALIGSELWELVVYEALLFLVVQFHHANISVSEPADRLLRIVIPSPYMHKVHHSTHHSEFNTNYTSLFSIWDRLFGSYAMRQDWEGFEFGLAGQSDENEQRVSSLVTRPFRS